MSATFQNSAMVLSIGIFFTLIILGLASSLPAALYHGLVAQGVSHADAARIAALPPVSVMFAALLGYNPIQTLLGHALTKLPASHAAFLTGRSFFPALISPAFSNGLHIAFDFAIAACLIAAVASLLRGSRYVHEEHGVPAVDQVRQNGGPQSSGPQTGGPQTSGPQTSGPQTSGPQTSGPQPGEDRAVQSGPAESGREEPGSGEPSRVESGRPPVTANVPEDSRTASLRR
jgi:hypothetical protein